MTEAAVSDDLIAFIKARLDEDEDDALDLARGYPAPWSVDQSWVRDATGDVVVHDEYHWGALPHIARHDPARALRRVAAIRKLIAEITATPHEYIDGDPWFSCSQAVYPDLGDSEEREPGEACADENRAGKPCDCGRDAKVRRMLGIIAGEWSDHPGHRQEWAP